MKKLLMFLAMFASVVIAQDAKMQQLASQFAAATGQPYEVCLKALTIREWCVAHPRGGELLGATYDAAGTANLQHRSMVILGLEAPGANAAAPPAAVPASQPSFGGGLAERPTRAVGRSTSDPQRRAEMEARAAASMQPGQGGAGAQQLQARRVAIGEAIKQAISQQRMLRITCDVEGGSLIEPHLLGVTPAGNWAVQAWLVEGAAVGGGGAGWRVYPLDRIVTIEFSDRFFQGARPGYDPTGKTVFQAVQTSLGGAAVIPIR